MHNRPIHRPMFAGVLLASAITVLWQGCSNPDPVVAPSVTTTIQGSVKVWNQWSTQDVWSVTTTYTELIPVSSATVVIDSGSAQAQVLLTDSTGGFSVTSISTGKHRIQVSHPAVWSSDTIVTTYQGSNQIPLTPYKKSTQKILRGSIASLDSYGNWYGLEGAKVVLDPGTSVTTAQNAGSSGTFAFFLPSAGQHRVQVTHTAILPLDTVLTVTGDADNKVDLLCSPPGLAGTVTCLGTALEFGTHQRYIYAALSGAMVSVDPGTSSASSQTTGADGHFSFPQVTAGNHRVTVSHPRIVALDTMISISSASSRVLVFNCLPTLLPFQGYIQRLADPYEIQGDQYTYPVQFKQKIFVDATVILDGHDSVRTGPAYFPGWCNAGYFDLGSVTPGKHRIQAHGDGIYPLDTTFVVTNSQFAATDMYSNKFYFLVLPNRPLREFVYPLNIGRQWTYTFHAYTYDGPDARSSDQRGVHTWQVTRADPQGSSTVFTVSDTHQDTMHLTWKYPVPGDSTYPVIESSEFTILQTADSIFVNTPFGGVRQIPRFHHLGTDTLTYSFYGSWPNTTIYISGLGLTKYSGSGGGNSGGGSSYALVETH